MRLLLSIFLAVLIAADGPAVAQDRSAAEAGSEILVQGRRIPQRSIERFVEALTETRLDGQIGQFSAEVCPASIGLSDAQNDAVVRRMRRIAAAAGIPVAGEGCRLNGLVIVARDKEEVINGLQKVHPGLFREMSDRQVRKLARAPGPAAAWQVIRLVDANGQPLLKNPETRKVYVKVDPEAPNRLMSATRPDFAASILVVEVEALGGLSTTQLADYAALRTLAKTNPARAARQPVRTILTMIEDRAAGRDPPLSLTQWDLKFLTSLYAVPNTFYATFHRAQVEHLLSKDSKLAEDARE